MQIGEFQALMVDLYGEQDAERGIPSTVAWLCRGGRRAGPGRPQGHPRPAAPRARRRLAWLASLANQLGLSLEDAAARYRDRPADLISSCWLIRRQVRHQRRRARSASAICTALRAAPLRRLSPDRNSDRPCVCGRIDPDATHEGGVDAGRHERRGHVGQLDARALIRTRRACSGEIGLGEAGVDRQRVAGVDRHPHAGDATPPGRGARGSCGSRCGASAPRRSRRVPSSTSEPANGMTL